MPVSSSRAGCKRSYKNDPHDLRRMRTDLGLSWARNGRCSTRYCRAACQVQHWKGVGTTGSNKTKRQAALSSTNQVHGGRRSRSVCRRYQGAGVPRPVHREVVHRAHGRALARVQAGRRRFCPSGVLGEQAESLNAELAAADLDLDVRQARCRWSFATCVGSDMGCRAVRARGVLEDYLGRPGTCWTDDA